MRRRRGSSAPPGISDPAPAVAALLRRVAELPEGTVVFQDSRWKCRPRNGMRSGRTSPTPTPACASGRSKRIRNSSSSCCSTGSARGAAKCGNGRRGRTTTRRWRAGAAIANALAPADFTGKWTTLDADRRRLAGIRAVELATAADEAQAIALALREALETPGRTAALVTPDRALAERVAAHCARWGIAIDDTAGRPLATRAPGTLLTVLAEAAAQDFAPLRVAGVAQASVGAQRRRRALVARRRARARPRAARAAARAGLDGVDAHLRDGDEREAEIRAAALLVWPDMRALLEPIARCFGDGEQPLAAMIATLRETAQALCGDMLWAGPAGRAAAELLAELEVEAANGPPTADPASVAPLLRTLMEEIAVRPPQGGHPRLAIYGLIEARLQTADLMILGGLNEGAGPPSRSPTHGSRRASAPSLGCRGWSATSASPRTISPTRWARRKC